MASDIEICNRALVMIGQEPIMTLDESSKASRRCKQLYSPARDKLLREHPWSFAMTRKRLAKQDVAIPYGYSFSYALPTDCLRVVWASPDQYVIEGLSLLTDSDSADLRYVKRITDPNLFDAKFTECLVIRLACDLTPALTANYDVLKLYEQKLAQCLSEARHISAIEQPGFEPIAGTWITARI